jgi:hypothetical protein
MPRKKSKQDIAAEKIASLLIEHMEETLTPAQGKTMLKDLKAFSSKPRRSFHHGKPSRSAKTAGSRPYIPCSRKKLISSRSSLDAMMRFN